jgi:hypothetical protein
MEFGPYQLQVFVSLVMILGASLVALICDYLKGHNEQLRELTLELKVRREEEHRLVSLLTARNAAFAASGAGSHANAAQAGTVPSETHSRERLSHQALGNSPEPERALSRAEAPAAQSSYVVVREMAGRAMAILPERKREVSVDAAPAMQRSALMASAGGSAAGILHELVATASAPSAKSTGSAVFHRATTSGTKKDWNSLLAAQRSQVVPESRDAKPPAVPQRFGLLDTVMAATSGQAASQNQAAPSGLQPPTGFQNASMLRGLIEGRRRVSGLIVSIGITSAKEKDKSDDSQADAVRSAVESLLEPGELAGPSGPDEFVLLLPAERGASAQRRLSRIAQQLWDFQLGYLSKYEIQFTWGGIEVREEPLDEAAASAVERMRDTRRGRFMVQRTPAIFRPQSV